MDGKSETVKAITEFLFIGKADDELRQYDLVILLGSNLIELTVDKLAVLYSAGIVLPEATVVLSGKSGALNKGQTVSEAEQMLEYAVKIGMPGKIFRVEPKATNLYENYKNSKAIIEENGSLASYKSILSIGQAFSLRRAKMSAARCGYPAHDMDFVGIVDSRGRNISADCWWQSDVSRVRVLQELGKISEYALKGDISL